MSYKNGAKKKPEGLKSRHPTKKGPGRMHSKGNEPRKDKVK
jgi:hypothetical protein